jgi:hypothetical protein
MTPPVASAAHSSRILLCVRVLERLFPDTPEDAPPWDTLRWANGRIALPDHPRLENWRWFCSPREE